MKGLLNKYLLFVMAMVLFYMNVHAEEIPRGSIKGTVVTSDGNAAPSVTVLLKGTKKYAVTDEKGEFILRDVQPGTYELVVSLIGFNTIQQSVTVEADKQASTTFQLSVTDKQLQEVEIIANSNKFAKKETYNVSRLPITNLENPQVYSVITKELMGEQIVTDYRDAVKNAAGVNTLEQVSNGRSSTIIRGFRTPNFLRNGLVASQLTTIDVSNVERIEVIKGPSGTLFGSGAVSYGGVVNRVTKRPFDVFKTEVTYTGGSFGLGRLSVDMNTPLDKDKKALLRVNAARHSQESFQETGFMRNYFFAPTLSYQVNDKLSFLVDAELYRNFGTSVGMGVTPNTAAMPQQKNMKDLLQHYYRTYSTDDLTSTFPGYNFYGLMNYKFNSKWSSSTSFNYGGIDAKNQLQFTPTLLNDSMLSRQVQKYNHHYYAVQVMENINGEFNLGPVRNRAVIGFDYLADVTKPTYVQRFLYDSVNYTKPAVPFITIEKVNQRLIQQPMTSATASKTLRYGAYASDVVNITEQLLVMLSLRLDKIESQGSKNLLTGVTTGTYDKSTLSPKLGIVYQVIKDQLSVFGNYMNGFNYTSSLDINGNVFKPEKANQLEGGLKLEMLNKRISATATYYNIEVSDKLRTDPNDNRYLVQDGTQRSKGFEAELIANPIDGLNIVAGYGYNDSKYTKAAKEIEGKTPARAPKHMLNTWISYRVATGTVKGLGLGFGGNYNSNSFYDDANTFTNPSFVVLNASVFYDQPRYRLGIKADNLGDQRYWGPYANPQPPRSVVGSVTVKF